MRFVYVCVCGRGDGLYHTIFFINSINKNI